MFLLLVNMSAVETAAQQPKLDSLLALAANYRSTATMADTLLAKLEMKIGSTYLKQGGSDSCIRHQRRSLDLLEGITAEDRPKQWWNIHLLAWKFMGRAHQSKGDAAAALEAYQHYYKTAVTMNWRMDQAAALDYMGVVHAGLRDHDRATELHREAIAILEHSSGVGPDLAIAYGNLAKTFAQRNRTDSALMYLKKALPLLLKDGHPMNLAQLHLSLADNFMACGELDSAEHYLDEAEPMVQKWNHAPTVGQFNLLRGALQTKLNDHHAAEKSLTEAVAIAKEMGHQGSLAAAEGTLAKALGAQRDSSLSALRHRISADSALLAHLDLEKVRGVATRDLEFQRFRDSLLAEERIREEKARASWLLFGMAMALAVASALIYLIRRVRKESQLVLAKNEELVRMQHQLVVSERRREAELVRTHIARDVHDQLGSDLTKLVMLSTEAKALASEDPRAVGATALDIERVAAEANRSLGDIVWAIDPHHDSLAGLTERVREHCERMLKRSHIGHRIDCRHEGPDRSLDPATKRDLYLILREALNNALKYAQATHIEVSFLTSADGLRMMVKDDGIGLASQEQSTGHGLANMRARAERIGATFSVDGTDGTTVRLAHTLPPV